MKKTLLAAVMTIALGLFLAPKAEAGLWDNLLKSLGFDASRPGKFETWQDANKQFHFHLKAGNGQVVLVSEAYKTAAAAKGGIDAILRDAGGLKAQLVQTTPPKGQWHFVWRAANYQVTGASQLYSTKDHALKGAETVIKILRNHPASVAIAHP